MFASVVLSATLDSTLNASPLARLVTLMFRCSGAPASVVDEKSTRDVVFAVTLRRRNTLLGTASNAAVPDDDRYLIATRSVAVASTVGSENGAGGVVDTKTTVLLEPSAKLTL